MGLLRGNKTDAFFGVSNVTSVIGQEAYFQGTLTAKGSLRIDGKMEGAVVDGHSVIIGETGKMAGDISAQSVVISGEVKGDITAAQHIELLGKGRVTGDIRAPRLFIEEGAFFDGKCSMAAVNKPVYEIPGEKKGTT